MKITNKLVEEDPFLGIDIQDDAGLKNLKILRDRITFKKEEKEKLIKEGFTVDFSKSRSEVAVSCEIVALLSPHLQKEDLENTFRDLQNYLKSSYTNYTSSFTRHDISLFRSYRILFIENLSTENLFIENLFIENLILLSKDSPSVYAVKNEIIKLLCYRKFKSNQKQFFYVLSNPNLQSTELLSSMIGPENYQWISISHILQRKAFGLAIKWYSFQKGDFRPILQALTKEMLVDKKYLWDFGKLVEGNREIQEYCSKKKILQRILERFSFEPEVVYAISCMVEFNEENRKYVGESPVLQRILMVFKEKTLAREYDEYYINILKFLRGMSRSILFLRSKLLDYPIVELLVENLSSNIDISSTTNTTIDSTTNDINITTNTTNTTNDINITTNTTNDINITTNTTIDTTTIDTTNTTIDSIIKRGVNYTYTLHNTSTILLILSNLVFEYGNYKKKFIPHLSKALAFKETHPEEILVLLKNYLFESDWLSKEAFIKATEKDFFDFFFSNSISLETLFNLIRNLVCEENLEMILVSFNNLVSQTLFFLRSTDSPRILLQIYYTIANLSANSPSFRDLVLEDANTTDYANYANYASILEILKEKATTRDLKLAFVWIIINISWKEEGSKRRVEKLKASGIKEFLLRLEATDSVLLDKINTALENIK
ncbi:Armadillo repeat-containing protein 8 [Nosema granulosis]|uniref:Armadillo repeat-containing protein 8 n=1 Tax=Nosema granulosis TaxID=83296 RepID=A0A9P6GY16_9MICR|nr:Armadillo repeat-containing protein 8 [Nosema granulosis]